MLARLLLVTFLLGPVAEAARAPTRPGTQQRPTPASKMRTLEGRYYVIHTDLSGDDLREADLRMTKMFEEYRNRTREFSGTVGHKFRFFLFRRAEDYYAAGGGPGSAGMFNPNNNTLMAIAGDKPTAETWDTVQHEGFHQYATAVIGGELPVWVNEGLAEYFGAGLFTGDGFVTGLIPQERLKRVRQQIISREFQPIQSMMLLAHRDWNEKLSLANYDQAWSMVQFLAHAENGKYQRAFVGFMRAIGTGVRWDTAWQNNFGSAAGFEEKWRNYWLKMPDNPTADLFAKATMQTLSSVLARTWSQKQQFPSFEALTAAAEQNELQILDADWLPPALIAEAFEQAKKLQEAGAKIELSPPGGGRVPVIICTLKDGRRLVGKFTARTGGRWADVTVTVPGRR